MEQINLGALIVAGIWGIGLIQLIMWIVVMIRHPGIVDLLYPVKAASSLSTKACWTSGTQSRAIAVITA